MITITKQQATQFILAKQGLIGSYQFIGKAGAYDYVRQAGSRLFRIVMRVFFRLKAYGGNRESA